MISQLETSINSAGISQPATINPKLHQSSLGENYCVYPNFKDDGHHSMMAEKMGNNWGWWLWHWWHWVYQIGGFDWGEESGHVFVWNRHMVLRFHFPGRFILWFVSMISHPEPDVFFVDPKLWQFSWGCLRPAILPAMFVGLAQSQRTMKTSSQLLKDVWYTCIQYDITIYIIIICICIYYNCIL